ncbi:MAG TPA: hypothetical protein PKN48_03030 [Bacteroidales bacterium]|nr:hypothetical protein [Bacteroidales bacterium]
MTNRISRISQLLVFSLLALVSIYALCFIQDKTTAYLIFALSVATFIIYLLWLIVRKRIRRKRNIRITQETPGVNASILAVNATKYNVMVLQLRIGAPGQEYITSLTVADSEENRNKYSAGRDITVFVDPDNLHHVIIPEPIDGNKPRRKFMLLWIIYSITIGGSVILPIILGLADNSDRDFKDIAFIKVKGQQENIWEVLYESPKKIFINIYDPRTNKKIKSIKDKKREELDYSTNFIIVQQDQKVFIIGTGKTPLIDVYDALSFAKISDIKTFEKSNSLLAQGISEISNKLFYYLPNDDGFIEITTNDGNKCYYNIPDDKFYYSEKDLDEYVRKTNDDRLLRQMFSFALSKVPEAVDKHQLYLVEINSEKGIDPLRTLAGTNSLHVDDFNDHDNYYYSYCKLVPLMKDKFFLEGKIIYSDASMVVIQHVTAINKDAKEIISGIGKSGNTLFTINQSDYPNSDDMIEDHYNPRNYQNLNIIRSGDNIIFLFAKYGGLCVEIKTGIIQWKLEL